MSFKKRMIALLLLMCTLAVQVSALGCARGVDELGNRYKTKTEGKTAALSAIDSARAVTEQISDINYVISLMKHYDSATVSDLGIENEYFISGRGTDDCDVYCTKTYYGLKGNEISAYYLTDGYIYTEFCDTMLRAPIDEQGFYEYVASMPMTAELTFLDRGYYGDGAVYTYSDGSSAAVLRDAASELEGLVVELSGITAGEYSYTLDDLMLRYEIDPEGVLTGCELSFQLEYYKLLDKDKSTARCTGSFGFEIKARGEAVTVKVPQSGVKYSTVSDISKLTLLSDGYEKLISLTDVAATYKRTVENADISGTDYLLDFEGRFTQSYRDGVYNYGSIDKQTTKLVKDGVTEEEMSSVGMFVDDNGIYHYRELDRDKYEDSKEAVSTEEWLTFFANTLSTELFYEEDICRLSVSEDGDIITFGYSFGSDTAVSYAEYLLSMFSDADITLSSSSVSIQKNTGVVKIRVSDGCLIYHSMEFEASVRGSIGIYGSFELDVTATGEDVTVLDTSDWEVWSNKNN